MRERKMEKEGVIESGTICSHAGRQAVFEIGSEGVETRGEKGGRLVVGADRHLRSAVQGKRSAKPGHT